MKKICIISNTAITNKCAGPSIRMLKIAKSISKKFECKLYSEKIEEEQLKKNSFLEPSFFKAFFTSDTIYSQPSRLRYLFLSVLFKKNIIIDLYDPTDIEYLEMYKSSNTLKTKLLRIYSTLRLKYAIFLGDYFVCSSEQQKDYWIGYLQSLGKIKSKNYIKDPKCDNLIGLLPFGLDNDVPKASLNPIISKYPSISEKDKIFIWAGGIWNWFDSINLIKAMSLLKEKDDIKLLFLGTPNIKYKDNPKFKNAFETIELSKQLGLYNKNVFFNDDWVEYEERHNYLLNSYCGISLHYDNLETRYSYRTRILDYFWCNLPFITSNGDFFAKLNSNNDFGLNVDYENIEEIANSIKLMSENIKMHEKMKNNIDNKRNEMTWDFVCRDLLNYLEKNIKYKKYMFKGLYFLVTIPIRMILNLFLGGF